MKTMRRHQANRSAASMAGRILRSERGVSLVTVIMLMIIILAITSAGMFFSSVELRASGNYKAGTQAFYAADAGVSDAVSRINMQGVTISPTALAGGLSYCSGPVTVQGPSRCGSTPEPSQLRAVLPVSYDYNIVQGTGYNTQGYVAYQYQVNMTGLGPLTSARGVQAQVDYGPVPQ
jgi:Tfp pilus assembly protein PilX